MNPEREPDATPDANPYAAPKVDVDAPPASPDIPARVLGHIRVAWIAGVILTVITLARVLVSMQDPVLRTIAAWSLVDVVLLAGLTFGIYRKSRVCAVLMVVQFVISRFMFVQRTGMSAWVLVLGLIFLVYYVRGVIGTFQYHRLTGGRGPAAEDER